PGLSIGTVGFVGGTPAATGGRTASSAAGRGGKRPLGFPAEGWLGGGTRVGAIFGCKLLVPVGPLNETSRGVILSIRQSLTASPSAALSGLSPLIAKIAIFRPGLVTIPVSLVSARSESGEFPAAALCGGRRELLNSGRASIAVNNSSIC